MAVMEHMLLKYSQLCQSSKVSERKKGANELSALLNKPEALDILNSNSFEDRVNWNTLFLSVHYCLVTESGRISDESTGSLSASTITSRQNALVSFGSLVLSVFNKAKSSKVNFRCDDVLSACFRIFGDRFLLKTFGVIYLNILQNCVLQNRKYWMVIQYEKWKELYSHLLQILKIKDNWNTGSIILVIESLELVIKHGCKQSYLGLDLKQTLLPYLTEGFTSLCVVGLEDALFSLVLQACYVLLKESRTGVCQFGETILKNMMMMYSTKFDETNERNSLLINFMLLQVKCHHPQGSRQGTTGAYACDWSTWNRHLSAMYRIVVNVLQRHERAIDHKPLSPLFLNFCVALCNQLFDNPSASYDTFLGNETTLCSLPKKRKVAIGLPGFMDELRCSTKDSSCLPWLSVISALLSNYPALFSNCDLEQVFEQLSELQCASKDSNVMGYVCKSFELLVNVMHFRKIQNNMWLQVWETTLRTIGLNQNECESHSLIRSLILKTKVPTSCLESLLKMFQARMIQISRHSLETLNSLLSHYSLPECSIGFDSKRLLQPWEQPLGASRMVLLEWLLPFANEVSLNIRNLSADIVAKLLVMLTLRVNNGHQVNSLPLVETAQPFQSNFEEDYMISAFGSGLLLCSDVSTSTPNLVRPNNAPAQLVDKEIHKKLLDFVIARFSFLEENFDSLSGDNDTQPTERRPGISEVMTVKSDFFSDLVDHAYLVACILSNMVDHGIINEETMKSCAFIEPLKKLMINMGSVLAVVLNIEGEMDADQYFKKNSVENTMKVVRALLKLYGAELSPAASLLLREVTPSQVVTTVVHLLDITLTDSSQNDQVAVEQTRLKVSDLMDNSHFTDHDTIPTDCISILTLYSCPRQGAALCRKQQSLLSRLFKTLLDAEICDLGRQTVFCVVVQSMHTILNSSQLDKERHLRPALKIVQALCRHWNQDAEASSHILSVLKDILKHASKGEKYDKEHNLILVSPFMKKKFGPVFTIQLVMFFEEILKVDESAEWARWKMGLDLNQLIDRDELSLEATRQFRDENGYSAMAEELVFFLNSPYHEVRLVAIKVMGKLFNSQMSNIAWQRTIFERVAAVANALFLTEGSNLNTEERIDESSNRTACVLHILAVIIGKSTQVSTRALLLLFRLIKVKNLNLGLVGEALSLLPQAMNRKSIETYLERSLPFLLESWLNWGFLIQDFPFRLLEYRSLPSFLESSKDSILRLALEKDQKDLSALLCQELRCTIAKAIEVSFPVVIAQCLPFIGDQSAPNIQSAAGKRLYEAVVAILGNDNITRIVSSEIGRILVELSRLVVDAEHYKSLFGFELALYESNGRWISYKNFCAALKYLQMAGDADEESVVYGSSVIQYVLLKLRADVCAAVMPYQRLLSLHHYCVFYHTLATPLKQGVLQDVAEFVILDVSHTLLYLIRDFQSEPLMMEISIACCRYLKIMFETILPTHAEIISRFLPTIVGIIVPLAESDGPLAEASLTLMNLITVVDIEVMTEAIGQLPPFPEAPVFERMRHIHTVAKYGNGSFDLEKELIHFLGSVRKSKDYTDWGRLLEGLQFLRKQLSEKKNELLDLYKNLEDIRGFSEDCNQSVLHQLISTLINLASSTNLKIQLEAARCLGELGPADLTTLVLKPAEDSLKVSENFTDPLMLVLELAVCLLSDCLLDVDVGVVQAASEALYSIMATKEADALLASKKGILHKSKVFPFISKKSAKKKTVARNASVIDSPLFRDEVWCPDDDVTHETWIATLVSAVLKTFSEKFCFFGQFIPVIKVKTTLAEKVFPVLINLAVNQSIDMSQQVSRCMSLFFAKHCAKAACDHSSSPNHSANVYLNKPSVQCMINVVNFIHSYKTIAKNDDFFMDINYLHVAKASQFCSAHFSSIMYAELWCHGNIWWNSHPLGGSSVPPIDYIRENTPADGIMLQALLREAYTQIGDHDAVHGCGSSMLLNPSTRVKHYEHIGMWNQVLLDFDLKSCRTQNVYLTTGLIEALKHSGLLCLMNKVLSSLPCEHKELLQSAQLECMWRLGHWENPVTSCNEGAEFEWSRFAALKCIYHGDLVGACKAVEKGRFAVLPGLIGASLESCNTIYKALGLLQALQEIEDIASSDVPCDVLGKWSIQYMLPQSDFLLFESISAQRAKALQSLVSNQRPDEVMDGREEQLTRALIDLHLFTARLAREESKTEIAEIWLHSLSAMPSLSLNDRWLLRLEEAQLAWSRGRGAVDTDMNAIARLQLLSLLEDLKRACNDSKTNVNVNLHARVLILYGTWMVESRSETPQKIIENYLKEALSILDPNTTNEQTRIEAHNCLARFADLEFQRIDSYIKSESFQHKEAVMQKLLEGNDSFHKKSSALDEKEIKIVRSERNQFVELALRHYLQTLILGEMEGSLPIFRMVSLWLEYESNETILGLVRDSLPNIPSYKFVVLLPQLAARIEDKKNTFQKSLGDLLMRCGVDHPHHTLPLILALANSYKDPDEQSRKSKTEEEPRVKAAARMLSELRKRNDVGGIVKDLETLAATLISFAYLAVPERGTEGKVPRGEKIYQLQNLENALVPIINLPVQSHGIYDRVIGIHSFSKTYTVAHGLTRPKKILCIGTDGFKRPVLVKGKDDLRQDAVMQQVFAIMNILLRRCKETRHRKLTIRTYKVVPLTQKCGVLEWCEGTDPLGIILKKLHLKYHRKDFTSDVCLSKIKEARNKSNTERLRVYNEVCRNFHPAFRFFFTNTFPTPAEWFEHRLAYIHSAATNSMVGYILGLGDRHVQNILVDVKSAELIHIDFGIAFEQGRVLPTPETVPFRLTRDIEDGMGVSGIEGVFRRSCEKSMSVLRTNQETIITILEVLLYDPLYAWTSSTKTVAKRQRGDHSPSTSRSEDESPSSKEKNEMAERALLRVKHKLQGTEEGPASSIEGQVNRLLQQAKDPGNLSKLFCGWQAYL